MVEERGVSDVVYSIFQLSIVEAVLQRSSMTACLLMLSRR